MMDPLHAVWKTTVCNFFLVLASLWQCARDGSCSRRTTNARTRSRGTPSVLLTSSRTSLDFADDEAFMRFLLNPSFSLSHAILASRRLQDVDWSKLSCFGWIPYSLVKDKAQEDGTFKAFVRKRGLNGKLLPSDTLPENALHGLSENYFRHRDFVSAVRCHWQEVSSLQTSDLRVPATSPD